MVEEHMLKAVKYMFAYYLGIVIVDSDVYYSAAFERTQDLNNYLSQYHSPIPGPYEITENRVPMPDDIYTLTKYFERNPLECTGNGRHKKMSLTYFQNVLKYAKNYQRYYQSKHGNVKLMRECFVGKHHPTFGGDKGIYKLFFEDTVSERELAYAYYYVLLLKPDATEIGFYNFITDKEILYKVKELPKHIISIVESRFGLTKNKFGKFNLDEPFELDYKRDITMGKVIKSKKQYFCPCCGKSSWELEYEYNEHYVPVYTYFKVSALCNCNIEANYEFGSHGWYMVKDVEELLLC